MLIIVALFLQGLDSFEGVQAPLELAGTACAPALISVFSADGELAAEWHGLEYSSVYWLDDPERLSFPARTSAGDGRVEGSPVTRRLRMPSDGPPAITSNVIQQRLNGVTIGAAAEAGVLPRLAPRADLGGIRNWWLHADGVWFGDRLVLPDRDLDLELQVSPSGRWISVVRRQPWESDGTYVIRPDGSRIQFLGLNLPRDRVTRYWWEPVTSPDGRWSIVALDDEIELRGANGDLRTIPATGVHLTWAPDSSAFAFLNVSYDHPLIEPGIAVATLDGQLRSLVSLCWHVYVLDWTDAGIVYYQSHGESE